MGDRRRKTTLRDGRQKPGDISRGTAKFIIIIIIIIIVLFLFDLQVGTGTVPINALTFNGSIEEHFDWSTTNSKRTRIG